MGKLSKEDIINIYYDKINFLSYQEICKKYSISKSHVYYLNRLIRKHGLDYVINYKPKVCNERKIKEILDRIHIEKRSIWEVCIEEGFISTGLVRYWLKKYKENGYNIVERKRGRSPTMKVAKKKVNETKDETIKRLEEENLYLKVEIEYSKKLRAVVQARKNRQQKKK